MNKQEGDLNRRQVLKGVGASLASLMVPKALAQEANPDKDADFKTLELQKQIAEEALTRRYFKAPNSSETEVHERGLQYGETYKNFEKKHGVGTDFFTGKGRELKNEFHKWYEENKNASEDTKLKKLNELITNFKKEAYPNINNNVEDAAVTIYLRGFFCGYYENLCAPMA